MNEVLEMLADVPPTLAVAWAVWFGAGALLAVWYRKAKLNDDLYPAAAVRTVAKTKSAPRPSTRPTADLRVSSEPRTMPSGLQMSFDEMPSEPVAAEPYGTPTSSPYGEPRRDVAAAAPAREGPRMAPTPVAAAAPRPKPAPVVVGDPFGDLATLLDQPAAAAPAPSHRTPSDSPILNSAGSPILRD